MEIFAIKTNDNLVIPKKRNYSGKGVRSGNKRNILQRNYGWLGRHFCLLLVASFFAYKKIY